MIITKLQGGLGNQMFQYAAAKSMHRHPIMDLEFLESNNKDNESFTKRIYELDVFPTIQKNFLSNRSRNIIFNKGLFYKVYRKIFRILVQFINERNYSKNKKHNIVYFDGFFQSESYFKSIRDEIVEGFQFPQLDGENKILEEYINSFENSVSLHIRRGDYLKPEVIKIHGVLDDSYYTTAIELIKSKYPNSQFFIFSDDPKFAKKKYSGNEFQIVDLNSGKDSWKDMKLMTICKHHIVANSSFSWWGAWLSEKGGEKIAPLRWFNPENFSFDIDFYVPHNWVKI